MSHQITNAEYKRRVFNAALLEAIRKPYMEALGENTSLKGNLDEVSDVTKYALLGTVGGGIGGGTGSAIRSITHDPAVKDYRKIKNDPDATPEELKAARAKAFRTVATAAAKGAGKGAALGTVMGGAEEALHQYHNRNNIKHEAASQPDLVTNSAENTSLKGNLDESLVGNTPTLSNVCRDGANPTKMPGLIMKDGAGSSGATDAASKIKQLGATAIKAARDKIAAKTGMTEASQPDLVSNGAEDDPTRNAPNNPKTLAKRSEDKKELINSCGPEVTLAESMCDSYFTEELRLTESTISQTKERLRAANRYITEAVAECEEIADKHAEEARKEGKTFGDDEKIELTPEDNEVLDQLFHSKGPGPQIDQIRDATVKALISEEKKAKEVRDALDLAQSKVSTGDTNAYNETASRISKVGPTSLMGAIMNSFGRAAVNETSNAGRFTSVGEVLAENADLIKTRSVMLYAIMETGNQLEITHMNSADVERLARNIFYQK